VSLADWGLDWAAPRRPRLSSIIALYRLRLRRRWMQELLAVLGIASGVALLYATQVASTSLSGPVRHITDGLVGNSQLQLLSRGSSNIPESTYDQIVALPGVRRAAPVLQVSGNLVGTHGQRGVMIFGADPRIVKLRGNLLKGFQSSDLVNEQTIVVPAPTARAIGLSFGDDVRLEVAGRTITVPAAVVERRQIGALVDTSIVLAPLTYLQRLTHAGDRVTRILVEAEPGRVPSVRRELAGLNAGPTDVRGSDWEPGLFDQAAKPTSQASTLFSVLSALVGWLFAVCALLVTTADRRKLAAQQHAQGYPPAATLMTLLVDVAAVGFAGTALGLAAGELISRQGFDTDVSFLSGAFPIGETRVVTWQSVAIASAGGLIAAAFGVLAPLGDIVLDSLPRPLQRALARFRHPDASMPRSQWSRPLLIFGCACLIAAIAITIAAPGAAVGGLVLLALALVALLPPILACSVGILDWVNHRSDRSSIAAEFALRQLRGRRWRTRALAITTTGAVAVFGAASLEGARANLMSGLKDVVRGLDVVTDVWASPKGAGDVYGTSSFPPADTKTLAQLPAVRSVRLYRAGLVDLTGRRVWVVGAPRESSQPIPPHQVLEGDMKLAARRIRTGGWAAVSRAVADDLGLRVGQRFSLPSPRSVVLRVAAITTNLGWSGGAVVVNAEDFARAWRSTDVAAYHVQLQPGADPGEGQRQVAQALGPKSALRVETADQRRERQVSASSQGLARLGQISRLTVLAAVIAMGAAMIGLLWQHRPVVASLKLNGASGGLMWRALVIETGVLLGTGAFAGALFGLLGQVLCTRGIEVVTGFPVLGGLRVGTAISTAAIVIGASLLVVVVPGYLVSRARPSLRE
jgi:putative ABC transport system permease protein